MWLDLNGQRMQTGNTSTMIFGVATARRLPLEQMVLEPGDVVTTGTPPGVGSGKKPQPIFLKAGDVMELGVAKLGKQKQKVVAYSRLAGERLGGVGGAALRSLALRPSCRSRKMMKMPAAMTIAPPTMTPTVGTSPKTR